MIKTKNRHIFRKVPAEGTEKLMKKLSKVESRSMHGQLPIVWKKAEGFNVYDIEDNCYHYVIWFDNEYFKKVIIPSSEELEKHRIYLKNNLKKNFFS